MNDLVAVQRKWDRDTLVVDWFLGKRCNFDCSYCTPDIHDNFSKHIPLADLKNTIRAFLEKFSPEKVKIGFTGGEPCVHPEFHLFVEHLNQLGITSTTVTTNGSRPAKYYISLYNNIKRCTFSQHFEYTENKIFLPKIKEIFSNINNNKHLMVQIMYHSNYINEAKEAVQFYKDNNIPYSLRRIRSKTIDHKIYNNYSDDDLNWLINENKNNTIQEPNVEIWTETDTITSEFVHVNQISGEKKNNFKGWTCFAGISYIHIWSDGTVYRGNCKEGGAIGNINDTNFSLPVDPVICSRNLCFCAPEIAVKKYKSEKHKNLVNN